MLLLHALALEMEMMSGKIASIVLVLATCHALAFGQATEAVLRTPDDWNSEIISFPLGFAPEIDLVGCEDIRFAPGWSDPNSEQFWTYHFSWFVEKKGPLTEDWLTETIKLYYDGLTETVLKEQSDAVEFNEWDKTRCSFSETKEGFRGQIRVFDSFFTQDYIELHVQVREQICERINKQIISFDLSPRRFEDEVWEIFQKVEIMANCDR